MFPTYRYNEIKTRIKSPLSFLSSVSLFLLLVSSPSAGQSLDVDLLKMREKTRVLLHEREYGELPDGYMRFGMIPRPSFLGTIPDLRKAETEYDIQSGLVFEFMVPGDYRFLKRESREGEYYTYNPRDMSIPGMEIRVKSMSARASDVRRSSSREVWKESVRRSLKMAREGRGRRGLLDIDIPINLPKQIEWFIGEGEATHLSISGREEITIGGESRWCSNCPRTEGMPSPEKFPDLDMEQKLSVNLQGTVGEKIKVKITHSSHGGGLQAVNKVNVRYEGFEDDIIKLIEMGDTDLTLSGAQLIRYSGSAKGLFGVKTKAQVGPVDLTVIASKEEGETLSGTFSSSGGQTTQNTISDYGYLKRQFFFFENPGEDYAKPGFRTIYPKVDQTDSMQVFLELNVATEWNQPVSRCYINAFPVPENGKVDTTLTGYGGWYQPLTEGVDFELIQDYDIEGEIKYLGIYLYRPLSDDKTLAVKYINSLGDTIGDYWDDRFENYDPQTGPGDDYKVHIAELICPRKEDFGPTSNVSDYPSTWNMMMRNVYSLNMGNISEGSLDVRIEKVGKTQGSLDIDDTSGLTFLHIFGLDTYDFTGEIGSDDRLDDKVGIINYAHGYLMFPWYEPFNVPKDIMELWLEGDASVVDTALARNSAIYDTLMPTNQSPPNFYEIVIEGTSSQRSIQLNAFNIIEGSEVVRVAGQTLSRGTDYTIDYFSGTVTLQGEILNQLQSDPSAKINVDYQTEPIVGGGTTSLVGVAANYEISSNARLNGMFLYNSVGASRYKPRLGDEPSKNMAADLNGSFVFSPSWMTSIANLLPRVDTAKESQLNFGGEVAVSIPDPNTKGDAYVDDMEGVEDSDRLSMIRSLWHPSSPPLDPDDETARLDPISEGVEFYWYNPATTDEQEYLVTNKMDLNPKIDERENTRETSLFLKTINTEEDQWCGIMAGFVGGLDITTAQYLEIWVNDFTPDTTLRRRGGTVHVDFGEIDEDYYQPGTDKLDDEDFYNWTAMEDDYGFTGDDQSRRYPTGFEESDYDRERGIYRWINSRVGNSVHDTEDLNGNGRLDEDNNYYSLEFNLADSAIIDVQRDFTGYDVDPKKSWRMYRLDLKKARVVGGVEPRLDAIKHMRIWIENADSINADTGSGVGLENMLEITGVKFVGSKWLYNNIRDLSGKIIPSDSLPGMSINAGTINNKDNPSIYSSPYKVEDEEGIVNREQSLIFDVENFADSTSFRYYKRYYGNGESFEQYREFEFFYNIDNNLITSDEAEVEFYIQIAYDSLNYYELAVPINRETPVGWSHVNIELSDLTNMKIGAGEGVTERMIEDSRYPGIWYRGRLLGNPSLFKVRYMFVGLRNISGGMISETRFMLNDIAVGGVRRDIDYAARGSFAANFGGGILSLNGSWTRTGPEFRSLQAKKGSGVTSSSISLSGDTRVEHLIPTIGFELPFSANYSSSTLRPKYMTQSDVEIKDDAVKDSLLSASRNYGFRISLSRRGSSNFLMKNFFDNLRLSYSYSKKSSYSPVAKDSLWSMSGNVNYTLQFSKDRTLDLFKGVKWRYWLSNLTFTSSGSRSVRRSYSIKDGDFIKRPSSYAAQWNNNLALAYDPFESIKIDYQRGEQRDLGLDNYFHGIPIGILKSYSEKLSMDFKPRNSIPFISGFNPSFRYRVDYKENLTGVRRAGDPADVRNASANRNININFSVNLGRYSSRLKGYLEHFDKKEEKAPAEIVSRTEKKEYDYRILIDGRYRRDKAEEGPGQIREEGKEIDYTGRRFLLLIPRHYERRPESRGEGGPGVDDEAESAPSDTTEAQEVDRLIIVKKFMDLIGRMNPIGVRIDMRDGSSYQRLYERAALGYRFGLTEKSGVAGEGGDIEEVPVSLAKKFLLDMDTKVEVTETLNMDIGYNFSNDLRVSNGRETKTTNEIWPRIGLNWTGLEKIGFLKKYIKTSTLNVNFTRNHTKSQTFERTIYKVSPDWTLMWKNTLHSTISISYQQENKEIKGQQMWNKQWSVNLNFRYDISGEKGLGIPLPFLSDKKVKFKSKLTSNLNLGYSINESYNTPPSTTLFVSPRFTYGFSRTMTGSLAINYNRTAGGVYGYIYQTVGVHASANFEF